MTALESKAPVDGVVLYLFGARNPEIAAFMQDHGFRSLVRELFVAGQAPVPAEAPSSSFEPAVRCGLLVREGETYRAGPRLVPIPATAERELPELMRPVLAHYVEIAFDTAIELEAAYRRTSASERFSWEQVSHALIAGMFLDLAMGNEIYRSGQILRRPVGDTVVWAFEGISAHNAYGVQWTAAREGRALFAQLWHRRVRREEVRLRSDLVDRMARLGLARDARQQGDKELLYLRYLKLVRREGSGFRLQVPFFNPAESEQLLQILVRGARRLVDDAVVPALDGLVYHSWWRERFQQDAYRHAAVRLVLEYGTDRVIASRVIAPFPEGQELPAAWGRWLWMESESPLTLMPNLITRNAEGRA